VEDRQNDIRISFILTTMNRAQDLKFALNRVREYKRSTDELIIIDGDSTDATPAVLEEFKDLVDILVSEPDRSSSHAQNKGFLLARGRYIRHVTDDDELNISEFERAIDVLDSHPEIDLLVCGGTKMMNGQSWSVWLPPGTNYGKSTDDPFKYGAAGVGFIVRRSSLSLIGLHPVGAAADGEYVAQAIAIGANVRFCRVNLFLHSMNADSHIFKHRKRHRRHMREIEKRYASFSYRNTYHWRNFKSMYSRSPFALHLARRYRRFVLRRPVGSVPLQKNWDGGLS